MIFLVDTPDDIKSGFSYVIDRHEDSYTMIEGDVKIFDNIAFDLKRRDITSKPYDTIVLSFEEEDLTLDEIQEIYYDWKQLYLGSYDEDEYYLTSVIHWDDNHPHIHIGIINRGMINEKQLRMTRYGLDNSKNGRNAAIQEIINYKYGLKSPIGEKHLYQTTREQKKRDWEVKLHEKTKGKRGKPFYKVEDDEVYENMQYESIHAKDFDDFYKRMIRHYPTLKLVGKYEDEARIKIGNKSFKSLLFNKEFYNKHIFEIQSGADRFNVKGIRKSQEKYEEQYYVKNENHKKHLEDRKIHEGLLDYKIQKGELEFLKNSIDIDAEFKKILNLKSLDLTKEKSRKELREVIKKVHEYAFCKEDFIQILDYAGIKLNKYAYDDKKNGGYIILSKDGVKVELKSNDLYEVCLTKRNDSGYLKKAKINRVEKLKSSVENLNLNKRADIDLLKYQILEDVIELNIKNKKELESLLKKIGLEKVNEGFSVSKGGGYITLKEIGKSKKFSLYDDLIYSFYDNSMDLSVDLVNDTVKSTLNEIKNSDDIKPESIYEFQLKRMDEINLRAINMSNDSFDIRPLIHERDRKATALIEDYNDELIVKKALNYKSAGDELVKRLESKRWENVRLTGSSDAYQKTVLDSLSYLSGQREESRDWIDKMMIETDLTDEIININKGDIYEVKIEPIENLDQLMEEQYIYIESRRLDAMRENREQHHQKDSESVKKEESIKEDYQEKLGNVTNKKIYLKEFTI